VDPEDLIMMGRIDRQYLETPFYGVLRMAAWLRRQGLTAGVQRVRRLMRQMGLEAIYSKPHTTIPAPENRRFPYLLQGLTVDHPDHVWCIDITYVGWHTGWAYLVAIMDWFSRYVLSWELSNPLEIPMAIGICRPWSVRCTAVVRRYSTVTRAASSRPSRL
jgi:putative transposase